MGKEANWKVNMELNENQKLIIVILNNEKNMTDELLSYFIEHSGPDKEMNERVFELRLQVEEIVAAIEWVKRQGVD